MKHLNGKWLHAEGQRRAGMYAFQDQLMRDRAAKFGQEAKVRGRIRAVVVILGAVALWCAGIIAQGVWKP